MKREWKPGDVAMVIQSGCERVALRGPEFWSDDCGTEWDDNEVNKYGRPLAVIDPEDRKQVERFAHLLWPERLSGPMSERSMEMLTDALCEFANPASGIEAPRGLGAVIEDVEGDRLTHIGNGDWVTPSGDSFIWSELKAIRVLSEGVAP